MTPQPDGAVRRASADDMAAVQEIYAHHVRHGTGTFDVDPPSVSDMRSRWQSLVDRDFPYLVAALDRRVVGFAYCSPYRERPAYRFTVEDSVYVEPAHSGRGIGRALLTAVVAECERRAYRQMVAVVGDSANAASIALHRGLGFVDMGVLRAVGYKHGRWLDTVFLQRGLGAADTAPPDR